MSKRSSKSGSQLAQENHEALKNYLSRQDGRPLPRYGDQLNQSEIARACGFDRKVFQTNPRCKQLLGDANRSELAGLPTKVASASASRERSAAIDAERAELESQNLRLMAEVASLRREVERFRRLKDLMANSGRLP